MSTTESPHPDLDAERAHLARAVAAREAMRARTEATLAVADAATEVDAAIVRAHLERRRRELDAGGDLAAFGSIAEEAPAAVHPGERRAPAVHVGRRHIEDDAGDPLVIDWRAPIAVPFYRATVRDPQGLALRRRYIASSGTLIDLLDEDFTDPDAAVRAGGVPDPLLAELDRTRDGTMRDIVATIAAEQDEAIRAPIDGVLVVQGGPGTGKTAVALHRAAFLLFEHRLRLLDTGVVVIGPSPGFLRYIAAVLPSLGEESVRQTTIDALRPASFRLEGADDDRAAEVKGRAVMAEVLRRALVDRVRPPDDDVKFSTPWGTVHLTAAAVAEALDEVLARDAPLQVARDNLTQVVLHGAYALHERTAETPAHKANYVAGARKDPALRRFLDRCLPVPRPAEVLRRLYVDRAFRDRVTDGLLAPDDRDALARPMPAATGEWRWTPADVPLFDELSSRLGGRPPQSGHLVVDEAQDLSAMACRMLARRAIGGSMTVVGDLAQGSAPGAQPDWATALAHLAPDDAVPRRIVELTVGYRTPAAILELANRLLPIAAPEVTPSRAIRAGAHDPRFVACTPTERAAAVWTALAPARRTPGGTAAVIAPEGLLEIVAAAAPPAGTGGAPGEDDLVPPALLSPTEAKGLEFDDVVVVEPAAIAGDAVPGLRALFVALSRSTQRLTIVHAEPSPYALR